MKFAFPPAVPYSPVGKESNLYAEAKLSLEVVTAMKGASSIFFGNKVHRMLLTRSATLSTSGAGAMALVTMVYPSQFDQYNQVSALFSECRIRTTSIQLAMAQGSTIAGTMACAFDPHFVNGSTTSVSAVTRLPGCYIYNTNNLLSGQTIRNTYRFPKDTAWSSTGANATASDPYGGVNGGWCNVALTTLSNTATVMTYLITAVYEFRNQF